jgi:nucleoside-diphosphate-sugar epimerase
MEVIGGGFLAGHLIGAIGDRHPHVTAVAAGVSSTSVTEAGQFDREAALVYDVLRRCRDRGRVVVFFSTASGALYGGADCPATEDGPVFPTATYGRHKLALERAVQLSGARHLVLRLSHLAGTGQRAHQLLPGLIRQVYSGALTVHRDATRDVLDVRHAVAALAGLLDAGVENEVVNVASGRPEPVTRIVDGIEERLGATASRSMVDNPNPPLNAVSVAKLLGLLPAAARFGFGPHYLAALLDRYVPALART